MVLLVSAVAFGMPIPYAFQDHFRKHMWDEAGQLAVAIGNEYCGYYGYNANGERVYKLTGTVYADQYETENGATYNGNAVRVRNSRRLTDTGAHEIGHTLGLTHSDYGIMTPSSNDSHRGTNNMPEFIENIISNAIHPTNGQIGKATIISPHSLKGYGHVRKIK